MDRYLDPLSTKTGTCCIGFLQSTEILIVSPKMEKEFLPYKNSHFFNIVMAKLEFSLLLPIIAFSNLRSFFLLKVIAKSKGTLIAFKSKEERHIVGRRIHVERYIKKRNYAKNEAKKFRSDNFKRNNKKSIIAIAIFENLIIG